jgi:hypothetical protein
MGSQGNLRRDGFRRHGRHGSNIQQNQYKSDIRCGGTPVTIPVPRRMACG